MVNCIFRTFFFFHVIAEFPTFVSRFEIIHISQTTAVNELSALFSVDIVKPSRDLILAHAFDVRQFANV
jgi:hypothetical protein